MLKKIFIATLSIYFLSFANHTKKAALVICKALAKDEIAQMDNNIKKLENLFDRIKTSKDNKSKKLDSINKLLKDISNLIHKSNWPQQYKNKLYDLTEKIDLYVD